MNTKIPTCPRCARRHVVYDERQNFTGPRRRKAEFQVKCLSCDYSTGWMPSAHEALGAFTAVRLNGALVGKR